MKNFAGLSVLIFLCACNHSTIDDNAWNNPYPKLASKANLQLTGRLDYPLDSMTSLPYPIIQYDDKYNVLVAFESYSNSFIIFDASTCRVVKKFSLSKDLKTGVGPFKSSFAYTFYFINFDSVLLYNMGNASLYLVDSASRIKAKYAVAPKDNSYAEPSVIPGQGLYYADNEVYLAAVNGRTFYNTNWPLDDNLVAILNLENRKIRHSLRYPPLYASAFWGQALHLFYTAYNPDKKCFVYSFPIDHFVYVIDEKGGVGKYYAGSKDILHVNPVYFKKGKMTPDNENRDREHDNFVYQRSYSRILYDKFAHVYYRMVKDAIPDKKSAGKIPFSVIILDENLHKIGEQEFDNEIYQQSSMVVTRAGLLLYRKDSGEDKISYDIFKLVYHDKH